MSSPSASTSRRSPLPPGTSPAPGPGATASAPASDYIRPPSEEIDELASSSEDERPLASTSATTSRRGGGRGGARGGGRAKRAPVDADADDEEGTELGKGGRWLCEWNDCTVVEGAQEALVKHLQTEHIVHLKDGFHCDWRTCKRRGERQATRHSLVTHCRAHTGERPYTCPQPGCGKTFTRSDAMNKHIRSLHGAAALPKSGRGRRGARAGPGVGVTGEGEGEEDMDEDRNGRVEGEDEGEDELEMDTDREGARGPDAADQDMDVDASPKRPRPSGRGNATGRGRGRGGGRGKGRGKVGASTAEQVKHESDAVVGEEGEDAAYADEVDEILQDVLGDDIKPVLVKGRKREKSGKGRGKGKTAAALAETASMPASDGPELDYTPDASSAPVPVPVPASAPTITAPKKARRKNGTASSTLTTSSRLPSSFPAHLPTRPLEDRQASLSSLPPNSPLPPGAGAAVPLPPTRARAYGSTHDLLQDLDISLTIERIASRAPLPMSDAEARAVSLLRQANPRGRRARLPAYLDPSSAPAGPDADMDMDAELEDEAYDSFDEGAHELGEHSALEVGRIGGGPGSGHAGEAVVYYRSMWANKYIVAKAKLMLVEEEMQMRRRELEDMLARERRLGERIERERRARREAEQRREMQRAREREREMEMELEEERRRQVEERDRLRMQERDRDRDRDRDVKPDVGREEVMAVQPGRSAGAAVAAAAGADDEMMDEHAAGRALPGSGGSLDEPHSAGGRAASAGATASAKDERGRGRQEDTAAGHAQAGGGAVDDGHGPERAGSVDVKMDGNEVQLAPSPAPADASAGKVTTSGNVDPFPRAAPAGPGAGASGTGEQAGSGVRDPDRDHDMDA